MLPVLVGAGECAADDGPYSFRDAQKFLGQYCVGCHGPEKPKGKLDLARFTAPEQVPAERKVWGEVLKRVRTGEMPPRDAKATIPPEATRLAFLGWTRHALAAGTDDGVLRPGPAPVRRLNKSQYRDRKSVV